MKDLNDKQLIDSYIEGDEHAFVTLYEKYKKPLYSYLVKFLSSDRAIVDDVFQEAWVKVINNINKYSDNQNFFSWVITIARNLAFDKFRKASYKREKVDFDESYIGASSETPDKGIEKKELVKILEEHTVDIPTEQKEVYILRSQGVSFKDIAQIQGVSLNTALGRMHYVVSKLRPVLRSYLSKGVK